METKYYVNEAKGTVACVVNFGDTKHFYDIQTTGVAKLNVGDEWDEELGKKIGNAKAHRSYHKAVARVQKRKLAVLLEEVAKAQAELDKQLAMIADIEENIHFLGSK